MKRYLFRTIMVFLFILSFWPAEALACSMKLAPASAEMNVGDIVTFRLERTATHRSCVLPLEQTVIKVSGGEVVDPGVWKKGSPDVLEFKVRFIQSGTATVIIERNCSKDGLQTTKTTVQVLEKPVNSATTSASTQKNSITPPAATAAAAKTETAVNKTASGASGASATSGPTSAAPEEHSAKSGRALSWQEGLTAWWPEYSAHFLSWVAVFTAGLLLSLRKVRSLRKPLLFFSLILTGFYLGGCPTPVGAWYYLLAGNRGILGLVLFLLAVPVLFSFLWGRVFCGWMCPIGAAQELVKSEKILWSLPPRYDHPLRALKILLLALFSAATLWTGINYWGHQEPFKTLFNFDGSALSIILLVITMGWSVVSDRPFCRYFCPLGAILAVTSRSSLSKIEPEPLLCVHCAQCAKDTCCPTGAVSMCGSGKESLPVIDFTECISCGKCGEICRHGALQRRKIGPKSRN